jgi:hypothetical protein
MCALADA